MAAGSIDNDENCHKCRNSPWCHSFGIRPRPIRLCRTASLKGAQATCGCPFPCQGKMPKGMTLFVLDYLRVIWEEEHFISPW